MYCSDRAGRGKTVTSRCAWEIARFALWVRCDVCCFYKWRSRERNNDSASARIAILCLRSALRFTMAAIHSFTHPRSRRFGRVAKRPFFFFLVITSILSAEISTPITMGHRFHLFFCLQANFTCLLYHVRSRAVTTTAIQLVKRV